MAQHPLFDTSRLVADQLDPDLAGRLGPALHEQVFGALPPATGRALDVPEVAVPVRALLARRWRPAQLAARVGALPAADAPVGAVVAFLTALLERDSPQQAWDAERAERDREREAREQGPPPASDAVRAHWAAEARRSLARTAGAHVVPPRPVRPRTATAAPACATCGGPGELFVTREVRLCGVCVGVLRSGTAQLAVRAAAG